MVFAVVGLGKWSQIHVDGKSFRNRLEDVGATVDGPGGVIALVAVDVTAVVLIAISVVVVDDGIVMVLGVVRLASRIAGEPTAVVGPAVSKAFPINVNLHCR